ncbi:MAG: hypothetical protein FJ088_00290 [Deltaproteobacteria bacterium]|nr:hypothetical protein [Deltaproteobacteria bacterium]
MKRNSLLFIVMTIVASGCGGGGTAADIQFQEVDLPDQFQEEVPDAYETKEAEVFGDAADNGDVGDGVELDVEDADAPEAAGFVINRPQFSGGFADMAGASFGLRIGIVNHPLGKKTELKSANFRLKAGFIAAIKGKK